MRNGTPEVFLWAMVAKTLVDDAENNLMDFPRRCESIEDYYRVIRHINLATIRWKNEANSDHFGYILDWIDVDKRIFIKKINEIRARAIINLQTMNQNLFDFEAWAGCPLK